MLFNFELEPLSTVSPWGESDKSSLRWFGLTEGQYWIQAGEHVLLEYSKDLPPQRDKKRYCDYYIIRLYEDLMAILPFILGPVPKSMKPYISGGTARLWEEISDYWYDNLDELNDDVFLDINDVASTWKENRCLDSGYLSPGSKIAIWSDDSTVYIEWDNREIMIGANPAWSAQFGSYALSKASFIAEVKSFHERFMNAMAERVESITSDSFPPHVGIDIESLRKEQKIRSSPIDRSLNTPEIPTDWDMVYIAVREIEKSVLSKKKD